MSDQNRLYWHLLTFSVPGPGTWTPVSFMVSTTDCKVTVPVIQQARQSNNLPEGAILTGFFFAAYATKVEVTGVEENVEETPESALSQAERELATVQGERAAHLYNTQRINAQCPYNRHESENQRILAGLWAQGFESVVHATAQ